MVALYHPKARTNGKATQNLTDLAELVVRWRKSSPRRRQARPVERRLTVLTKRLMLGVLVELQRVSRRRMINGRTRS